MQEIVFISMGTMIGAGIFILPGIIAAKLGPASILAFFLSGLTALITGLSAAEMACGMPMTGGSYYFLSRAFGAFIGSIIGWGNWLSLFLKGSFALIGFGDYLQLIVPVNPVITALLLGMFLIIVNMFGTRLAGRVQFIVVLVLLAIIAVFIIAGMGSLDPGNLSPFFPRGAAPILPAMGLIFVAYIGLVKITSVSEEIVDPERNLPLGIIISTCAVIAIYTLIMLIIIGVGTRGADATLVVATAYQILGRLGRWVLIAAGMLATLSTGNAAVLAASRYPLAMARDRLMPRWFLFIDPRRLTPINSLMVTGGLMLLFAGLFDVERIVKLAGVFNALVFSLINGAVIVMNIAAPTWYRPVFKVPLFPWLPVIGLAGNVLILFYLGWYSLLVSILLVLVCAVFYLAFAPKNQSYLPQWRAALERRYFEGAVKTTVRKGGQVRRILLFTANPGHIRPMATLAGQIARSHQAEVIVANLIKVPPQTPLDLARKMHAGLWAARRKMIAAAGAVLTKAGVPNGAKLFFVHDVPRAMIDLVNGEEWDMVVIGWDETSGHIDDFTHPIHQTLHHTDRNTLVIWERGMGRIDRVLVPVDYGPYSRIQTEVAVGIAKTNGAKVIFLKILPDHVGADHQKAIREYLQKLVDESEVEADWALEESGNEEEVVKRLSGVRDLIVLGGSRHWSLKGMFLGTTADKIAAAVECSVIMTRPARKRRVSGKIQRLLNLVRK